MKTHRQDHDSLCENTSDHDQNSLQVDKETEDPLNLENPLYGQIFQKKKLMTLFLEN